MSVWIFFVGLLAIFLTLILLILISDCDLTLAYAEKYGKALSCFKGQVVWIIGASTGIGEYLAYELVANGAKVVISGRRVAELEKVKAQCLIIGKKAGITEQDVLILPADVTKVETHEELFKKVLSHFGQLDVLINNAGRSQRAHFLDIDLALDRDMFEGNVFGLLNLTRIVVPHFLERKQGHIAVTSSVCGKVGAPFSATYNATKHALHGYFETVRAEFGPKGIIVTMLCPGPVFSDLLTNCATGKYGEKLGGQMNPNDRRMSTERCAHLCAVAIANRLDEAWMAPNPVLFVLYASQYLPSAFRSYFTRYGAKQAMKMRDSRDDNVKKVTKVESKEQ